MSAFAGESRPSGSLGLQVIRGGKTLASPSGVGRELSTPEIIRHGFPQRGLAAEVNEWRDRNLVNLMRGWKMLGARTVARKAGLPYLWSQLWLAVHRPGGARLELGLAGYRVVTTTGMGYVVDAFQNLVELEEMKYHGFGTGGAAEDAANTALTTELTTEYVTNNTRPTGTTTEGASANIYRTVGTLDPDADVAITEHGIFSDADVGQGVLLDRTLFAAVNLDDAGDSLVATYEITFPAGS